MSKKIYAAKLPRVLLALVMVMSLAFAFLTVNAFADDIIIVGGSDNSTIVGGTTGGTTTNNGNIVVVGPGGGNVAVTKSPTSETVEKGGAASFVARADNAESFVWRLVSPDASNTINATAASSQFAGLWVDGTDTDTLTLGNIPESLNGWYVECKFNGQGGPVFTNGAKIIVSGAKTTTNDPTDNKNQASNTTGNKTETDNAQPVLPTITSQPKGTNLQKGQITSLSVTATTTDDSTLNYQWYASSTNSTTSGTPIAGAISAQYQPPEKEGSMFYYVAIWGTKDGQTGTKIFSTPVEVTYAGGSNSAAVNNPANSGGQLVIDAGPTGGNTSTQPGTAGNNSGTADRVGTPSSTTANNTSNTEAEDDGSTAVVMLVIALVALVACLGLVVKSGLLTRK